MKKIKLVKKRDEVSDAGDLKISIYKPEKGRWEHYGEEAQTKKLVEELAELITAIARDDIRAIREEMADVEVMIMQFKQGFNIDTLPIMNYKLNRTLARIENEKNK